MKILQFLNKHALAVAIVAGAIGYPFFRLGKPLLPYLIFMMLFFTFCKVNPLDLRLHKWHLVALSVQLVLALAAYYLVLFICRYWGADVEIAQSAMLCLLMPTATAAPIIAGKLGGSIQNLTTFTLLSNFTTAIIVPVFFPVVNPAAEMGFWMAAFLIVRKVGPLLMGPFFAAWLLRLVYDARQKHMGSQRRFSLSRSWAQLPFYIWACTIVILMGDMTYTLIFQKAKLQ